MRWQLRNKLNNLRILVNNMKQYEVLNWASSFLKEHNSEEAIAEILLLHYLDVNRSTFYMNMQETVSTEIIEKIKKDIHKHIQTGVPVQHLTGYEYFYGRKFYVNEHTLIPRPETEELVLHVIEEAKKLKTKHPIIVDIGTGSGVIAVSLAKEMPHATVYATDISVEALSVAKKNAQKHQADVIFYQGDFLKPIRDHNISPDIIVSNPPYIAKVEQATMSRTVKDFDPGLALFAEENGLAAYEQITALSTKLSHSPQMIAYEIGYQQGKPVSKIIKNHYPQSQTSIIQDINNKDRIVSAKI